MASGLNRFFYLNPLPAKSNPLNNNPKFMQSRFLSKSENACSSSFDSASFEADRLRLDAEARDSMAASAASVGVDSKAWKWNIRKRIWDLMEMENVAQNPRPVHHRIPNFVGVAVAAEKLGGLEAFKAAQCVKVNPDSPQKQVRFLTLTVCNAIGIRKSASKYHATKFRRTRLHPPATFRRRTVQKIYIKKLAPFGGSP